MRTRIVVVVLLVSVLALVSMPASLYAYHGKGGMNMEDKFSRKAKMILSNQDELGLSDDQVEKIKALKMKTKKGLIRTDAEIDIAALEIKAEMWADSADTESINKLIDKKYDLKKQKAKSLVAACAAIRNILTKEQQDKMKAIMKKCKMGGIRSSKNSRDMKQHMIVGDKR